MYINLNERKKGNRNFPFNFEGQDEDREKDYFFRKRDFSYILQCCSDQPS